jgi:hypothetical protein
MSTANNPAPSDQDADSLDLLAETSANIRDLLSTWYTLSPSQYGNEDAVTPARDRGTAGKEIMEQSALRLAAIDDVARVLRQVDEGRLAMVLDRNAVAARRITARLDDLSRGVSAIDLRYSDEFYDRIDQLRHLLADELDHQDDMLEQLDHVLGSRRSDLRSAPFIRGHAPIHPSELHHWYQDIAPVVRIHALYDRVRSFPGAESTPTSDVDIIKRYDPGR